MKVPDISLAAVSPAVSRCMHVTESHFNYTLWLNSFVSSFQGTGSHGWSPTHSPGCSDHTADTDEPPARRPPLDAPCNQYF